MDLSHAEWRKASYSTGNGGNCVEVARNLPGAVAVRDSKDPDGPALVFAPTPWRAFVDGVKSGRFDLA
jgi:ABC-type amino acid transport substrate-binding protein